MSKLSRNTNEVNKSDSYLVATQLYAQVRKRTPSVTLLTRHHPYVNIEHDDTFMYEGAPYLATLQAEIDNRHVNETVFAKFTPVIATPTRSQTAFIMGRPVSPAQTPSAPSRPTPLRHSTYEARSQDVNGDAHSRRSLTLPPNSSNTSSQVLDPLESISDRLSSLSSLGSSPLPKTPRSTLRRNSRSNSTVSMGSNYSLKSKSSTSSLTNLASLLTESAFTRANNSPYYGAPISRGSSPASSTSSLSSVHNSSPAPLTASKSLPSLSLLSTLEGIPGPTPTASRFSTKATPPSSPSTMRSRQQPFK